VEESRTIQVNFSHIWEDVERRLNQLKEAQAMVIEDSEILRGTPIIKGTRIPLYDVVSLIDSGTSIEEILEIYPRLKKSQIGLASIYAKANPQRAAPSRGPSPKSGDFHVEEVSSQCICRGLRILQKILIDET